MQHRCHLAKMQSRLVSVDPTTKSTVQYYVATGDPAVVYSMAVEKILGLPT